MEFIFLNPMDASIIKSTTRKTVVIQTGRWDLDLDLDRTRRDENESWMMRGGRGGVVRRPSWSPRSPSGPGHARSSGVSLGFKNPRPAPPRPDRPGPARRRAGCSAVLSLCASFRSPDKSLLITPLTLGVSLQWTRRLAGLWRAVAGYGGGRGGAEARLKRG